MSMVEQTALGVETLEVPSDPRITFEFVTGFIMKLPQLGREFTRESADKLEGGPGKGNLPRILSYLKYLGLLTESRVRAGKDGEDAIQKFTLTEVGKRLYYHVESGRTDKFAEVWRDHIRGHPVFQVVFQRKFSQHPTLTMGELQDLVYEAKGRTVSAAFARQGAEFLARMYSDAELVSYDRAGQKLSLASSVPPPGASPSSQESPGARGGQFSPPTIDPAASTSTLPSSAGYEEYSSRELHIRIVPTARNVEKARKFLSLVELELTGDPGVDPQTPAPVV
jgi:hypothetical protein